LLQDYFNVFATDLTHYLPNNGNRLKKIDDRKFPPFEEQVRTLPEDEDFGVRLCGYPPKTNAQGPSLYTARTYCTWVQEERLNSDFSAHVPMSWAVANGFESFREMVRRWCDILEPVHGLAGPSLLWNGPDSDKYMGDCIFMLKKFPGLDSEDTANFSHEAGYLQNVPYQIRSINWLTVLGDKIIGDLGGRTGIRAGLGETCLLADYRGGIIIQAGPKPQFGSTERGVIPEDYRKVAALVKPVRFEAYRYGLFRNLPTPLNDVDETLKWVRRFD